MGTLVTFAIGVVIGVVLERQRDRRKLQLPWSKRSQSTVSPVSPTMVYTTATTPTAPIDQSLYANAGVAVTDLPDAASRVAPLPTSSSPERRPQVLEDIQGIGPAYAQRLRDADIYTFADLAAQTPEHVRTIIGSSFHLTDDTINKWLDEAKQLAA